jgi:basic amino acid/polyamine antiporter, APA family
VGANERDAGLVRAVGTWGLAASIVSMVVGAGIFALPGALAATLGPFAPLAILVCSLSVGAVAVCFADAGSRIPCSGGAYGYIETAFGPLAGYVAGTQLWFGNVLACGAVAAALADTAVGVLPMAFRMPGHALVIVAAIGGIATINAGGVGRGVRLVSGVTVLKLVPLAIFVLVGASAMHAGTFQPTVRFAVADVGRALLLALFTFMGMETSLCASGEVAQPARTIPRALALAMVTVTLLYMAVQVVAQGILGASLSRSTAPLADAMASVSRPLQLLMVVGAAVSMFGWLSSDILSSPRTLFALARAGMLPRMLGRAHPRTHAPHVAIIGYAALAIVLALTGSFVELAVLSTLTAAVLYIGGCAAALKLARSGIAQAGTPLNFRWLGTAATFGIVSMAVLIALASRAEIAGLLILIGLSVAVYLLQSFAPQARARRR